MKTRNLLWLGLASAALALPATAQDEAPETPAGQAPPPAGEAGPPAGEAGPPAGEAGPPAAETAGEAGDQGEAQADESEEQSFIFSEEIPADQQVTFPVDI